MFDHHLINVYQMCIIECDTLLPMDMLVSLGKIYRDIGGNHNP